MRHNINLHKGTMFFYILGLMWWFDNFTTTAYLYLAMHGSYGFLWIFKDYVFEDPNFTRKVTLVSLLLPWPIFMVPYMAPGYLIVSSRTVCTNARLFAALMLYINGVVLMLLTDAQKCLVLRERRGLITHCMHGWSRNMNYLGEIMIYASFATVCQRWEVWAWYGVIWGFVF